MKSILSLLIICTISIRFNAQHHPLKIHSSADTAAFFDQTYSASVNVKPFRSGQDDLKMVSSRQYDTPHGVTLHKYFQGDSVWYTINPYDARYSYKLEGIGAIITLEDGTVIGGSDEPISSGDLMDDYGFMTFGMLCINQEMVNKLCRVRITQITINGKHSDVSPKYGKRYMESFRAVSNSRNGKPQLMRVKGLP